MAGMTAFAVQGQMASFSTEKKDRKKQHESP